MNDKEYIVKASVEFIVKAPDIEEALACAEQVRWDHYQGTRIEWIRAHESKGPSHYRGGAGV